MFDSRAPESKGQEVASLKSSLDATVCYVTLAQAMRVKRNTLHKWVMDGRIPQPTYYGRLAAWPIDVAQRIVRDGTQPPGTYPRTKGTAPAPVSMLCVKHLCELICPRCKSGEAKKPAKKTAKKTSKKRRAP